MRHFYNDLTRNSRTLLDASTGGALMSKITNDTYQLLENMALNNCQWPSERLTHKKPNGVHELDVFNNLAVQVLMLTKQLQSTQQQNAQAVENVIQAPLSSCDFRVGTHLSVECQIGNPCGQMSMEQAQYLNIFPQPQFNPCATNFNLCWRIHLLEKFSKGSHP